jgi:hypothetical protein
LGVDRTAARDAYGEFLALWKDADSDVPVLIAAKAELSRLLDQNAARFGDASRPRAMRSGLDGKTKTTSSRPVAQLRAGAEIPRTVAQRD